MTKTETKKKEVSEPKLDGSKYSCQVILEKCTLDQAHDRSLPTDARLIRYKVDGKDYDIRYDRSRLEWACDCKAFTFRHRFGKKYCKHILEVKDKRWALRRGRAGARVV